MAVEPNTFTTPTSGAESATGPSLPPQASAAADKAKEFATSQLSTQKTKAAGMVSSMAESLRQAGEGLQQSSSPLPVHEYVNRAADQLADLGTFLNEREVTELVGEVENFARRQPALFLGAAFAAGVLASRFLRSSGGGTPMGSAQATGGYGQPRMREPVTGA